jgi:hypothetical protein
MAKTWQTWTVLPHGPIEKLADNLWRVSGTLNEGKVQRQMVLARRADGGVVVHNAIALAEPQMKELEAWGTPSVLFVPNRFHRMDAAIWKQRYPKMTVVAPAGSREQVAKVVPVDLTIPEAPADDGVALLPLEGMPSEGVLRVRSGEQVSLTFCDAVLNVPRRGGVMGFVLAPTGEVSVPRGIRWFSLKDRQAFADPLARLAETPGLRRLLFGHGKPVDGDAPAALRKVVAQVRAS